MVSINIEQPNISESDIRKCELCFEPVISVSMVNAKGEKNSYPCELYKVSLVDSIDDKIKVGYRSHFDVCKGFKNMSKTV